MKFSGASITCPECHHHWLRKPTTEEKLYLADRGRIDKRNLLALLQNGKCAICDKKLGSDITLDHIHPKSKGGENNWRNYQAVHKICNELKADTFATQPTKRR